MTDDSPSVNFGFASAKLLGPPHRFATLHVPETPQTKNMLGAREIAAMRAGSNVLNASRGH